MPVVDLAGHYMPMLSCPIIITLLWKHPNPIWWPVCIGCKVLSETALIDSCEHRDMCSKDAINPYRELCRGWYIGTKAGKKSLVQDVAEGNIDSRKRFELGRFGADGGEILLQKGLTCLGKTANELRSSAKTAEWKIVLGCWIKSQCGVTNQWLADHLHMGSMYNVSRLISQEQKRPRGRRKLWKPLNSTK